MTAEKCSTKSWGIGSMIAGIASILLFLMPYFALPLAIMAIVFHGIQKKQGINGYAIAGLVCGIIGTVINSITLLMLLFGLFLVGMF